ncbi:MAG: two-component system sensor histidine kinase CreC [Methylococcaceae bacterium]|nr:two-component system sensor histidine kinase CreC [Methylococcaceae bacterium]
MKLSVRLFLGYFLIVAVAGQLVLMLMVRQIGPGVRIALEGSLVDTANLLAELAAPALRSGRLNDGDFAAAVRRYASRPVTAEIYRFTKRSLDYRIYVTDDRGIVLFDSANRAVGQDYSRWNDVARTLQGRYGARSSLDDPADRKSSVMHVAAPIRDGDRLIGVLAVAYPTALLQPIVETSEAEVRRAALWLFGAALLFGGLFSWRLTRAIDLLVNYARAVTAGAKAAAPKLRSPEMATLARALETMREELEGRQYAERYVQTLTHEMKSPLAAIRGAAELLEDPLDEADRRRFAGHVREQSERLTRLIERLLDLAALEHRQTLAEPVLIDAAELLRETAESATPRLAGTQVELRLETPEGLMVRGEAFLLRQALSNLLDNAIDFAPPASSVELTANATDGWIEFAMRDHGPGIPDFAAERLFERFFSLPRPATGRKSTGIGLAFVREVALLHNGRIEVANAEGGGVLARLTLPAAD